MASLRTERVRELLKRQIGEIIRREFPLEEVGVIAVNDVDVTSDFQMASVYVGLVGTIEQKKRALEVLQKDRKRIQGLVGRSVVLKYTPQLRFFTDDSIARGNRVLEILNEIERSSPLNEGPSEDH